MSEHTSVILTGDWHLRDDTPRCRTDHFQQTQWEKVDYVSRLAKSLHNCPVLHSGDLFHKWKTSPWLLSMAMKHLPDNFYSLYGNHDLPYHGLDHAEKGGVFTLNLSERVKLLKGCHWNDTPCKDHLFQIGDKKILVWHIGVYKEDIPWLGCDFSSSRNIVNKAVQLGADLVLTGHYHFSFIDNRYGIPLVNPGSLTRQSVDLHNLSPKVFIYFVDKGIVEEHQIPYNKENVSRDYIDETNENRERLEAFMERLDSDFESSVNFKHTLDAIMSESNVTKDIKEIVKRSLNDF